MKGQLPTLKVAADRHKPGGVGEKRTMQYRHDATDGHQGLARRAAVRPRERDHHPRPARGSERLGEPGQEHRHSSRRRPEANAPGNTGHAATSPRSPGPPSASERPVQVVREFYAAVSSHDWPRVWQLGGRNLGQGPYATYDGMISGYRGTIRDVLTEIRATGDTVTGRFVAYQSGGAARPYLYTYVVRNGVIVSGRQQQG